MDRAEDEETENEAEVNNHSSVDCKSKVKYFLFSKDVGQ